MNRRHLFAALAAVALVVALWTAPAGAQFVSNYLGRTFTSSAPSGSNGFACRTSGCRLDLGTGASDYLTSDGANIVTPAILVVGTAQPTQSWLGPAQFRLGTTMALATCVSALEGVMYRQSGTGGTNTLAQTRFCVCVSDGAASPVYSWRNLISGTAGNSTTCNP
ncbi:MAG: hypothetical protein IPO09_18990 [Anaeromyxobacter sp.]|nr:hypothetical protein [Anaeromyxobacter sp.]MBL0276016.1 hypothetical protein [Anaeromyxobacter sp.]